MNNEALIKMFSKPVVMGFGMLLLGVLIGVSVAKATSRNPAVTSGDQHSPVAASRANLAQTNPVPDPVLPDPLETWDPFREMRHIQAEMDELFHRSIARFHLNPQMAIFKDAAGYSLSLDVRELKDRYEVHAFLPDAKASDAKVNLEGSRLEVEVTHQQTRPPPNPNDLGSTTEWGRYTQRVDLTGNLKSEQMKIERKEHELLITIPKN